MKKIIFIPLFLFSVAVFAQKINPVDSLYYLLDTAKTPINSKLWKTDTLNYPFKTYTLLCPCLASGGNPTFYYNLKTTGKQVSKNELKVLKQVNISTLINKAKGFLNNDYRGKYAIFLIEPEGKKYVIHQVSLTNPEDKTTTIEYESITMPDTTKRKRQ